MWIIIAAIIIFIIFADSDTKPSANKKETPTQILVYTAPSTEQDLTAQS